MYSCRITGWKFVCSECYDKIYVLLQNAVMAPEFKYSLTGTSDNATKVLTFEGEKNTS